MLTSFTSVGFPGRPQSQVTAETPTVASRRRPPATATRKSHSPLRAQASEDTRLLPGTPFPSSGFINATHRKIKLREPFLQEALRDAWVRGPSEGSHSPWHASRLWETQLGAFSAGIGLGKKGVLKHLLND